MIHIRLLVIIYLITTSTSSNAFNKSSLSDQEYDFLCNINIINYQRKTHGILHEKFFSMFMSDLMKDEDIKYFNESGLLSKIIYQADWLLMLYLIKQPSLTLDILYEKNSKKLILACASAIIIVFKYHCDDSIYISEIINSTQLLYGKRLDLHDLKKAEVNFLNTIDWNLKILYNSSEFK